MNPVKPQILALSLALFGIIHAPNGYAFTLQEAWEAARLHSADFQAAYHQKQAVQAQQQQARASLLPQLSAQASYQRQPPSVSSTQETQGWSLQLNQTLFDTGKTARYRQSRYNSQAAEQRYDAVREELMLQVAESYFDLLLSKDTVAAYASEKEAYAQQIKQARALFDKGAATALDLHEAQAGYDNALAQEIAAVARKQVQENRLNDYTGLDGKHIQAINTHNLIERYLPKLQRHSPEAWQNIALEHNHEYQNRLLNLQASRQALQAARNSRYPVLNANLGYQNNLYTSSYQSGDYRQRSQGLTVGLHISMPLYTGGELTGKIREAAAQYETAAAELTATERQIKLAVRQAYTEGHAARYQILAQERVLQSSRLKLKSTETGRQYGIRNSLEVIQARQEVAHAEQKLAQARYQFLIAYIKLIKESGLGVENALDAPEAPTPSHIKHDQTVPEQPGTTDSNAIDASRGLPSIQPNSEQ